MKISVFGVGYVGLVTGACLARVGNQVLCMDVNPERIDALNRGEIPIHEPGLDEIVHDAQRAGRLRFTLDPQLAVEHGQVQMIAVGTPPDEDGSADLRHVLAVAREIGSRLPAGASPTVVVKSTVPVGTCDRVEAVLADQLAARGLKSTPAVVSNPEFLKEGAAVEDFMRPDRIIVGTDDERAATGMRSLYAPFNRNHDRLIIMQRRSAELTKYAANAMLATKISFMNEMAGIAERLGADIEAVRRGIGADPRIGYHFIYPGIGYGGSCFPKDVRALRRTAAEAGIEAALLDAVETVNNQQKQLLGERILGYFDGDLSRRTLALWGLAFKPNTDDLREAPALVLLESLLEAGATVRAYDPVAADNARLQLRDQDRIEFAASALDAVRDADALAIATEWTEFRSLDFDLLARSMRGRVIFDGRNLYEPAEVAAAGFDYHSIGRAPASRG